MNLNERRAPVLSVASKTFLKTEASRRVAGKQNKKKKHFHTSVRPLGKGPLLCRSEGRSAKAERPLKGLSVRGWTKPALVSRLSAAQFPKVYFEWTYGRILWLETFTGMLWTRMFRNTNRYCFVKRSIPGLYFVYFRSFQTSITIFTIK